MFFLCVLNLPKKSWLVEPTTLWESTINPALCFQITFDFFSFVSGHVVLPILFCFDVVWFSSSITCVIPKCCVRTRSFNAAFDIRERWKYNENSHHHHRFANNNFVPCCIRECTYCKVFNGTTISYHLVDYNNSTFAHCSTSTSTNSILDQ